MPTTLAASYCERFLQPAQRMMATIELIAKGEGAIPILEAILDGRARNQWGIAYRQLGMPLECALAASTRLAEVARPLEPLLRDTLSTHNPCHVIMALGALGQMEEETRNALRPYLRDTNALIACEAVLALARCHALEPVEREDFLMRHPNATNLLRLF